MSQKLQTKQQFHTKWKLLIGASLLLLLVTPLNLVFGSDGLDWVVAGSFQDDWPVSSACGEWNNACVETTTEDDDGDGVHRLVADGVPAGSYEYKIVESGNWNNAHPANNVGITTDGGQVRWYFLRP
jgi:hypothetical protein